MADVQSLLENPTDNVTDDGCKLLRRVMAKFNSMQEQLDELQAENEELQTENEKLSDAFECSICYDTFVQGMYHRKVFSVE